MRVHVRSSLANSADCQEGERFSPDYVLRGGGEVYTKLNASWWYFVGPPPAFGGRRPCAEAAASAQRALAAA
jgi:hypothetical protein